MTGDFQGIEKILDIGKEKGSELLGRFLDFIGTKMNYSMEFEDIVNKHAMYLGELIRDEAAKNRKYAGGKLSVCYVDAGSFEIICELYFQNAAEKWIKLSSRSQPQSAKILREGLMDELAAKRVIKFDIAPPANFDVMEQPIQGKPVD